MLRSLSFLSLIKPTQNRSLQFINSLSSPLPLPVKPKNPSLVRGSISDVLQILGPIHFIFPNTEVCLYIRLLKKCIRSNDSFKGSLVHAHVLKSGYKSDLVVCNVLLDMYAKSGSFSPCQKLFFDEMPDKDLISWCTLISGFSNYGFYDESFHIFKSMFYNGHKPNGFIISSILKACAGSGILKLVLMIHGLVIKTGHGFDPFIEIGFVNSYSKCGNISHARKVFDEIPIKTTIAWNAMISGYVQNGFLLESLKLFKEMYRIGLLMDVITLRIVAFSASALKLLQVCKNIHVYAIKLRLNRDNYLVSELIKLLKNSGQIEYMKILFYSVKKPDPSLYSSVISALNSNGYREESKTLLKELIYLKPNLKEGDFVNLVNLCLVKEDSEQIHSFALKTAHFSYISVGNALISMYFKLGEIESAYRTFWKVPNRDLVSWTAVMTGFVQCSEFRKTLEIFTNFRKFGLKLDEYCVSAALNACTGLANLKQGKQIHALVFKSGFVFSDFLIASFINMYAKCGQIEDFTKLYVDSKLAPNSVLINVILSGFCVNSNSQNALGFFFKEYKSGFIPDQFSCSIILTACADLKAREIGDQIHSRVLKSGFENSDSIVGNSLINFFNKCGSISNAEKSFYEMRKKNENSYALLISGFIQNGNNLKAVKLFSKMQQNGILGNYIIFSRILKGCGDVAGIDWRRQIHASIIKIGLISDLNIQKALVGLYSESDLLRKEDEKESLVNYENAPDSGRNCELVDLGNYGDKEEEGGNGEGFLEFEISKRFFLLTNLGFLKKKQSVNLGFVRS